MKKEIAEKWIARLAAEDAPQQIKGHLGIPNGARCCLGVLCDIAVEEGVIPPPIVSNTVILYYEETSTELPEIVRLWAGMKTKNGQYYRYGEIGGDAKALAEDNDKGSAFKAIAVTIAKHVDEL